MRIRRVLVALTCVVATMGMGAFVGSAAAATRPANDKIGGATDVTALPFTQTLDVTKATTDAHDTQVNVSCGAPVTNNSVWYTFTAGPSDTLLVVDTTGSDYSSGVIIATGTPGALTTQSCGPVVSAATLTSGTKYYVLVFDDTGSGGTLQVNIHGPGPVPANDKVGNATKIGSLPYSDTLDTTGATTGSSDQQVASGACLAPSTGNSVWYKFTAGASDGSVYFDTSFSSYFTSVIVATGKPGALTATTCGLFTVVVPTTPGTTYYVMVFDFLGGGGGNLQLNAGLAPNLNVTAYRDAVVSAGGAHIKGTYSCARASGEADISGTLVEVQGNQVATGSFFDPRLDAKCDGADHPWRSPVPADSVPFGPGRAALLESGFVCGDVICIQTNVTQVLKLAHTVPGVSPTAVVKSSSLKVTLRSPRRTYGRTVPAAFRNWGH